MTVPASSQLLSSEETSSVGLCVQNSVQKGGTKMADQQQKRYARNRISKKDYTENGKKR